MPFYKPKGPSKFSSSSKSRTSKAGGASSSSRSTAKQGSGLSSSKKGIKTKAPVRTPSTAPEAVYSSLTLSIRALSNDGRGVADHDGRTIFVEGALVDEAVVATVTKAHSRYSEAKVKQVLEPSPLRIEPTCPVFKRCGGCSVQYMPHQQQLEFKQSTLLQQLSHWANIVPETVSEPIAFSDYGYRQRIRLSVNYDRNGDLSFGFRESGSKRLVDVDSCPVAEPQLQRLLPTFRQWLSTVRAGVVSHIELVSASGSRADSDRHAVAAVVRHVRPLPEKLRLQLDERLQEASLSSHEKLRCQTFYQSGKQSTLEDALGQTIDPRLSYELPAFGVSIGFHPQDFIQSNYQVNEAMVSQALAWMNPQRDEHIVDLFCGVGNFSLPLATKAGTVTGVEGVAAMVKRATDNAKANAANNTSFIERDLSDSESLASKLLSVGSKPIDGLLLDPPRAGAKEICQKINELAPKRIVYVSCDSATFARDAQILSHNGYTLKRLGVMDMFPQTSHVEVMGLFVQPKYHL